MRCFQSVFYAAGLFLAFAYDDVSYNKVATQSHTSIGTGYDANKAVDGSLATCIRTLDLGRSSLHKTVWWKVDLGRVYSIYNINILFKYYDGYVNRQKGRFAGFSLYISNTGDIQGSPLCYKNGAQLPPLNFTIVCTEPGRYVIFYNERLEGVVYPEGYEVVSVLTELCEVTVQGCDKAGVYGSNCDTPCPTNCKDNTCHIQNGVCFNCKPGWTEKYCDTKCIEGWHGLNCSHQCLGHCRDGASCNHITGQCDKGCDTGWTGLQCDEECDDGTYGYNCFNRCSSHCLNGSPCNKHTGYCYRGCNPGYAKNDCNKECPPGYFGINCTERCSRHCINKEPCDHVSGVCPSGCQDGFIGARCNNFCKKGYFGTNCSRVCSPNCKPDTCRHTDGWCNCTPGWKDENCTIACVQSYGEDCRHPCSLQCYNNTCDRFKGRCLLGCKDGFYGGLCDREIGLKIHNTSCSFIPVIGMSVSLLINLILIVCGILLCRKKKLRKLDVSGKLSSCWKRSIYQDIVLVKTDGTSTYQEIDLSENTYQNTAIR